MTTINEPQKLAIYYGWPSAVNGAGGVVNTAVQTFKEYDLVVFGAGLEDPSHGDHANTTAIINHVDMANTKVFGYIDAVLPLNDVQGKIDAWHAMGVCGIFLDQFGYDFGVDRVKQRELVWCIHEKDNLKAFVNAWNVDDVFDNAVNPTYNPNGLDTRLGAGDYYLAESFAIMNGQYDDTDSDSNGIKDFQDKAQKMVDYRNTHGVLMTACTTADSSAFDQDKADYSYFSALANEFDAWCWGEEFFSASSALLPMVTRKQYVGDKFTGPLVNDNGVITRQTNVGIEIDTVNHTADIIL